MSFPGRQSGIAIEPIEVSAYTVPTDLPASDGTLAWDATTMVVVDFLKI